MFLGIKKQKIIYHSVVCCSFKLSTFILTTSFCSMGFSASTCWSVSIFSVDITIDISSVDAKFSSSTVILTFSSMFIFISVVIVVAVVVGGGGGGGVFSIFGRFRVANVGSLNWLIGVNGLVGVAAGDEEFDAIPLVKFNSINILLKIRYN